MSGSDVGQDLDLPLIKICLIGSQKSGKSTFVKNLIFDSVDVKAYEPTIGVDFCTKVFTFNNKMLKCQFRDTSGQERFSSLLGDYLNESDCVLLFYSIDCRDSFHRASKLVEEIKTFNSTATIFLIGNKTDLSSNSDTITRCEGEHFAKLNRLEYLELSSRCKKQVESTFNKILEVIGDKSQARLTINKLAMVAKVATTSARLINRDKVDNYLIKSVDSSDCKLHYQGSLSSARKYRNSNQHHHFIDVNSNSNLVTKSSRVAVSSSVDTDAKRTIEEVIHRALIIDAT